MFPFYSDKEKENITFDLFLLHRWFISFKWPVLGPSPLKCLLSSVTTGRRLALSLYWQQDGHKVQEVIFPITWILNSGHVSFLKLFITTFVQSFAFSTWTEHALLCSVSRVTLNTGLRRNPPPDNSVILDRSSQWAVRPHPGHQLSGFRSSQTPLFRKPQSHPRCPYFTHERGLSTSGKND